MSNLKLFHYWRSSCSWRVRWVLSLKKIPCTYVAVNLLEKEQKSAEFTKKNPTSYVPCLQVDGEYFGESLAIIDWLEERYSNPSIYPQNSLQKLRVKQVAEMIASGIQPLQNLSVLQSYEKDPEVQQKISRDFMSKGLLAVEKILEQTSGTFSFAGQITLADICLIPQIYNAKRVNLSLNPYPNIQRVYENCLKTKACQDSAPDKFEPNK